MKNTTLIMLAIFSFSFATAQDIAENALGLRLGDSDGLGAEISYQRAIGSNNRIEGDLGWRNSNDVDAFKLTGIYQWVWNIDNGFNWYAGPGGGIVSWDNDKTKESGTTIFVAGDIGIEYKFDIPLLLSLDARPELGFNREYSDNLDLDIAFGIRYLF